MNYLDKTKSEEQLQLRQNKDHSELHKNVRNYEAYVVHIKIRIYKTIFLPVVLYGC
jgi:hypothetical protein